MRGGGSEGGNEEGGGGRVRGEGGAAVSTMWVYGGIGMFGSWNSVPCKFEPIAESLECGMLYLVNLSQ